MKQETIISIQNNFIWSLAVIGLAYMGLEFINSYNDLSSLSYEITPPIKELLWMYIEVVFYGCFVFGFVHTFVYRAWLFLNGNAECDSKRTN